MLNEKIKKQIDAMSYEELFRVWRHAPIGDHRLAGEEGEYFHERMNKLRAEVGDAEHTRLSKLIGWDK